MSAIVLDMVVGHGDALRAECVCFDYIGSGYEVFLVDLTNDVGAGEAEYVVVSGHQSGGVFELLSAEVVFGEAVALYHGSHGSIEYKNFLFYYVL